MLNIDNKISSLPV